MTTKPAKAITHALAERCSIGSRRTANAATMGGQNSDQRTKIDHLDRACCRQRLSGVAEASVGAPRASGWIIEDEQHPHLGLPLAARGRVKLLTVIKALKVRVKANVVCSRPRTQAMAWLLKRFLNGIVRCGALEVVTAAGERFVIGDARATPVAIQFHDRAAEGFLMIDPELAFGEL